MAHPRLVSKSFWSFASVASRMVSSFLVLFAQARLLGAVDFGRLAFGLSCAAILALFFDLGAILHALRNVAAAPSTAARQIKADARVRLLLVGPLACVAAVAIWITAPPGLSATFCLIYASVGVAICAEYNSAILRALGRYATEAIVAALGNGAYATIAIATLLLFRSVEAAAASLLIGRLIGFAFGAFAVIHAVPNLLSKGADKPIAVRDNFKSTLPYAKDVILANSMNQIDMALAGWLFTPTNVGLYAIASRVFQVINQMLGALANVFIPSLAANKEDDAGQARILRALTSATLILSLAACGASGLAGPWLGSILGASYSKLGPLWPVVGVAAATRVLASGSAMALTGSGLQVLRVRSLVFGFLVLVISGALAGAYLGLEGYLWAGAFTFAFMTVQQLFYLLSGAYSRRRELIRYHAAARLGAATRSES